MKYAGVVGQVYNPSTCGIKAGGWGVGASLGYMVRPSLKRNGVKYVILQAEPGTTKGADVFQKQLLDHYRPDSQPGSGELDIPLLQSCQGLGFQVCATTKNSLLRRSSTMSRTLGDIIRSMGYRIGFRDF